MALATLSIDLVAKLAKLEQDMGAAARVAEKNAAAIQRAFQTAGTAIAGLGIGTILVAQFEKVRAAVDRLDALDDLAEKTGVAASKLSGYSYAAEIAGTTSDDLATGIGKLAKNMAGAAAGSKEQEAAFKAIGVAVKNADGSLRATDEVLVDIAARFATYENGAAKAALAQELFGKGGAAMIPLLNRGRDGIADLTAEAERMGLIVSDKAAAAAGELNDNLKRLELGSQGLYNRIASQLVPALADFVGQLNAAAERSGVLDALWQRLKGNAELDQLAFDRKAAVESSAAVDAIVTRIQGLQKAIDDADVRGLPKILSAGTRQELAAARGEYDRLAAAAASANDKLKRTAEAMKPSAQKAAVDPVATTPAPIVAKPDDTASRKAEQVEKAYRKLMEAIEQRGALAQAELANNAALDEADRFRIDTLAKVNLAENGFSDAMRKRLAVAAEAAARDIEAVQIRERLRKVADEQAAAEQANIRTLESALDAQASQNRTLREQLDTFGLTAEQVERLRIARLQDALAVEQGEIAIAKAMGVGGAELELMREKAGLLEQEIGMRQQLAGRTEALQQDPLAGAGKGVSDYLDEIARAGDATRQAVGGAMRSLEDDLTQSLATGQLTVQRTVDMMISEFMRLALVRPLMQALTGGMSSFFGFAKGGAFDSAGVVPFAAGGVFDSPHLFRFADGAAMRTGVLGEAGPEAIMPLRRGPDGKLGVVARGSGGSPVIHQTINNRIDGSTDRAVIQSMVQEGVQQGMRAVMETLRNRGVLA